MPGLPYFAEFLMTLQRPGGGYLAEQAGGQLIVPIFPPNTSVSVVVPPSNSYASIGYNYAFSPAMIPDAFTFTFRHKGRDIRVSTATALALESKLWTFALVTRKDPIYISLTNVSGGNQYLEFLSWFIAVPSAEDLELVWAALRDLTNKGNTEFKAEALKLLRGRR